MRLICNKKIEAIEAFQKDYLDDLLKICPALAPVKIKVVSADTLPVDLKELIKSDPFDSPYATQEEKKTRYIFRSEHLCDGNMM